MEQHNKHLIIAGIAVVVVIALAIALPHFKQPVLAPTTPADTTVSTAKTTVPVAATPTAGQAAWDAMLKKYQNSSVTFAADCTASPITQALKVGTTVLLVNNSDINHTVTVGTHSYNIGARHYKPIMLQGKGSTIISCDGHQNVANIGVE